MTTEIQETFGDHMSVTNKQKMSEDLASNQRALDEGGGDNIGSLKTTIPQANDAGAHNDCSSSNNNNSMQNEQTQQQQTKLSFTKSKPILNNKCHQTAHSDIEDGFLSTSPDSANEELLSKTGELNETCSTLTQVTAPPPSICECNNPTGCVSVKNILESFKAPLSEEQAWALIYQSISLYRRIAATGKRHIFNELEIPETVDNLSLHRDGTIHCSWSEAERKKKEQKIKQQQQRQQQREKEEQSGGKCNNFKPFIFVIIPLLDLSILRTCLNESKIF